MPGRFITIEGIDGAGKTTQAKFLASYLHQAGHRVLVTYEPGGTPLGEILREMLLDRRFSAMVPAAELFLYAAARAEHVARVIRPALAQGQVVICDRFSDSTLVYQGYGRGLDLSLLAAVNTLATGGLEPDLTVVLDLPAEEAQRRLLASGRPADRLEAQGLEFLERLRRGYLSIVKEKAHRMVLVDAAAPPKAVFERIKEVVEDYLGERRRIGDAVAGPLRPDGS